MLFSSKHKKEYKYKNKMKLQNLRFQKYDKYAHPIFIASNNDEELENYTTLKHLAERIEEKQYDTFLPIYNSEEFNYSSIRFMKSIIQN